MPPERRFADRLVICCCQPAASIQPSATARRRDHQMSRAWILGLMGFGDPPFFQEAISIRPPKALRVCQNSPGAVVGVSTGERREDRECGQRDKLNLLSARRRRRGSEPVSSGCLMFWRSVNIQHVAPSTSADQRQRCVLVR